MKSWKTYMKSTVKDAAKRLPEDCREVFIAAFNECDCMDLYGGELKQYLQIIYQTVRDQRQKLNDFKILKQDIKRILNS